MIKGSDVIGKKIIAKANGREFAQVQDIIYDPHKQAVRAFLVDSGGWFAEAKVILFEDVDNIGLDAVMTASDDVIKKASDVGEKIAHIAKDDTYLTKTKIVTEDGTELGSVTDIYFHDESGQVEEFEVSQGIVKNLQTGMKRVKVSDVVTVGKDATIVRAFTQEQFDKPTGGVAQIFEASRQKAFEASDMFGEKVSDISNQASESINDPNTQQRVDQAKADVQNSAGRTADTVREKASQVGDFIEEKVDEVRQNVQDKKIEDAIGKYVTKNILDPQDEPIIQEGEMITHEVIQKAQAHGLLDQVLQNTSDSRYMATTR